MSLQDTTTNPSGWVNFFRWLGRNSAFPPPDESKSGVQDFGVAVLTVPAVIVIVGVLIMFALLCCLCCRCRSQQAGARPWAVKPSSKPLLFLALCAFAVIVGGSIACWGSGGQSFQTAKQQFDRLVTDLNSATTLGTVLEESGNDTLQILDQLEASCQLLYRGIIEQELSQTKKQLNDTLTQVHNYTQTVAPVASKLTDAQKHSDDTGAATALCLAIPLVLITLSCLVITVSTLATRGCGGSSMARCNDCCLKRLLSLFIALTILLAAIVAAAETASGVVLGSFCTNVDDNVLSYSQNALGKDSFGFQTTSYYITGLGGNPLNQTLTDSRASLKQARQDMQNMYESYKQQIQQYCDKTWTPDALYQDMDNIDADISQSLVLVSRDNVYPYYEQVVHEDMCNTVVTGLGWLVICQLVVGVFFLPVVACVAESFFAKWAAWQESASAGLSAVMAVSGDVEAGQRAY